MGISLVVTYSRTAGPHFDTRGENSSSLSTHPPWGDTFARRTRDPARRILRASPAAGHGWHREPGRCARAARSVHASGCEEGNRKVKRCSPDFRMKRSVPRLSVLKFRRFVNVFSDLVGKKFGQ